MQYFFIRERVWEVVILDLKLLQYVKSLSLFVKGERVQFDVKIDFRIYDYVFDMIFQSVIGNNDGYITPY